MVLCLSGEKLTSHRIGDLVSISMRTALYDLTVLVDKGVLVRVGTGKSSRYVLSSKPPNAGFFKIQKTISDT